MTNKSYRNFIVWIFSPQPTPRTLAVTVAGVRQERPDIIKRTWAKLLLDLTESCARSKFNLSASVVVDLWTTHSCCVKICRWKGSDHTVRALKIPRECEREFYVTGILFQSSSSFFKTPHFTCSTLLRFKFTEEYFRFLVWIKYLSSKLPPSRSLIWFYVP